MDTKLRSYRSFIWGGSSVLAVIAAEIACFAICALCLAYSVKYNVGEIMTDGSGYEYFQTVEVKGLDEVISTVWIIVVSSVFAALVFIVISLIKTGRKDDGGRILLNRFDRIFTDLQVAALFIIGTGIGLLAIVHVDWLTSGSWYKESLLALLSEKQLEDAAAWSGLTADNNGFEPRWLELLFMLTGNLVLMGLFLLIVQSVVKKLKAHMFWKNTIVGRFLWYLYEAAKDSEGVFLKVMGACVICVLLSATWFGMIPVFIAIFIFVPKWVRKYQAVKDGVAEINAGNLDYQIPVDDHGELDRLAESINEISQAMNIAVQNELKNQRMKTDLISNVSHDLRTPLTSMISYIDLLKTEGFESENAEEYLKIIDEKTQRLRKLTDDLFEAAKASSGNIPVDLIRLEMTSIVNQALAEMEERLSEKNLDVIFTNRAESVYVMADGQLLWRVIENLLTNVSKYALPGSRVYMDILEENGMICLDVKNISKEQLNISADELMERFKRGDESRNTEGSGLGLSIAKDLTGLMNGSFSIVIDGDLFKASVALKKA